jgi:hypothetical protein
MEPTEFGIRSLVGLKFIAGYSGIIVLFAVLSVWYFWTGVRSLKRDLKSARDILAKASGGSDDPKKAREALAKSWPKDVLKDLKTFAGIGHAWSEFRECLIVPGGEELENGVSIRNTLDPAHYFNRESVVSSRMNLRYYDSVPGLLTGLGILGTFIGLAAGIALAQVGLLDNEPDEVLKALRQLLDGASLAFVTSIAGLITSMVFVIIERSGVSQIERSLTSWNHELDRSLKRTTPEKVAVLQLDELKRQAGELKTFKTELKEVTGLQLKELQEQTGELKTFNTELVISISSALEEKVAGKLGPALERIAVATEALRNQQATATEDMLNQIVQQFGQTMSGAAGQEFEAISTSLRGLDEMLQQTVTSMREQEERSATAMNRLSGQVTLTLSEGSVHMRKGFEDSIQMMMASTKATLDDLSRGFEQMTESATTAARDNSEQLGRQIGAAIGKASGELDSVTGKMASALENAGTAASSRLNESANGLAERAEGLARSLADAETLTARLGQASRNVQEAALGVGAVLDGLKTVTPALTASSLAMRNAGDAISKASTTIGNFGDVSTHAAKQLSESNERIQQSWAQYVDRFEGSDEALANVVEQMEAGLLNFTERVTEFNRAVDRDFGRSINMLTSAIEELDQTLDERSRS